MCLMWVATQITRGSQINTLKKVVLWRIVSVSLTYAVMLLLTGDTQSATWFALCLHVVLMTAHFIFEKIWNKYEV